MRIRWRFGMVSIFLLALAVHALQDGESGNAANAEWAELTGSMHKMHAAMASVEPSGEGDMDFVRLMLPHHQAAIDMARAQLLHGTDPQLRRLAQEIIADQQSEVDLMQLWIKQHGSAGANAVRSH
jgi:uncharacterized protein (DUF305 family)